MSAKYAEISAKKKSTEPSYALNSSGDSPTEQGLSRNDNIGSYRSDFSANDFKNRESKEVNLEPDEDNDIKFDQDALSTTSNRESYQYLRRKSKAARDSAHVSETIFQLLEDEDELATLNFLSTHFVDLTQLRDDRGYTVLHIVAYKGLESMCKMLIQLAKDKSLAGLDDKEKSKRIKEWVNVKTNEDQFTALHMASFSGKYDIICLLIENKACIYSVNKDGLNMLHTAAQGDQAFMLYYFKELGLDINSKDHRGSTPLHWACFSKSEIAISYLLAWDVKIDEADQRGLTPLHLAVKAVNELNTTRPVRALLISGASRKKEDLLKRKPIDLVGEVEDPKLQNELKDILKTPSSWSCLMLKTPLKKMKKRPTTMLFYLLLALMFYAVLYLFIFPTTINYDKEQYQMFVMSGLGLLSIICLILGSCKNPGYLEKPKIPFLTLLDKLDPTMLCPECEVIRTPRSRHCSICNRCVERFDHHCPWINNCVGVKNHIIFMLFLFFTEASLICVIIFITIRFDTYNLDMELLEWENDVDWLYYLPQQLPDFFYKKDVIMGIKIGTIAACGFFVLPLMLLILVQLRNFCSAQTTNERFSRRKPSMDTNRHSSSSNESLNDNLMNDDPEALQHSEYRPKKSCIGNCFEMCCKNKMQDQHDIYQGHLKSTKQL